MKFQRFCIRHEPITVNRRKESAFARKQAREAAALPLFAEQIREEQHGWEDELQRRERANVIFVNRQRQQWVGFWRSARAAYFALPPAARAACKAEWDAWRGPHTPTNCIYVIEKHNGVRAERDAKMRAERRAMDARIHLRITAQAALV